MILRTSLTAAAALALAGPAAAAHLSYYDVDLAPLNDSGVSGSGSFTVNTDADTLSAEITADGLEAGQPHAQHIHGRLDDSGNPMDSVSPDPSADADDDDFVELAEAQPDYGPILVPLVTAAGEFPTAPDGSIDYSRTFDLNDSSIFNDDFDAEDVIASFENPQLDLREVVLHGMTVPEGVGAGTDGEVDGSGGYKGVLPVASGEITNAPAPIPLPAAGWVMVAGMGGLGALRARRKARTA